MEMKKTVPWFMWPFMAIWNLLALVLNITGRIIAGILGVVLMIVGIAVTVTIVGAPIGIPVAFIGLLLAIRSVF